ncbi:MAG: SpoIID/LytB domain-containing protein [Actinomycetes bacterium]
MTAGARRRSSLVALAVTLLAVAAVTGGGQPAHAGDVAGRPPDGMLLLDGRGFGHGRGMSQYGAHGAGLQGLNHSQILGHYYVGAVLGTADGAERRVLITADDADMTVTNVPGLVVTADGRSYDLGANPTVSRVRARVHGTLIHIEGLQGSTWVGVVNATAGSVRMHVTGGVVDLHLPTGVRQYRGHLTASRSGQAAKPLYVVNTVSIDDYVRGVVAAEMPASWHEQALRAQAVAARSYGLQPCPQPSTYPATGLYDVVDTIACQVYGGVTSEAARTNDAVAATSRQVLRYGGSVLRTEFSASNGGWTVANGGPFVAKADPYDGVGAAAVNRSEVHRWTGVSVPVSRLEQAHSTGTLREVRILRRDGNGEWGGRVLTVRLVGDARTVDISGEAFRRAAGIRSSWFDLVSPIDTKWLQLGGAGGLLGSPIAPEAQLVGGRFRPYQRGNIYWTAAQGAHETHGAILQHYGRHRWEGGVLGYPVTDEMTTPDGRGRYNHFERGSVYWTPSTGAWEVHGSIRAAWQRLRWELGPLGYPVTDERTAPDGAGRYNHFERGSVYWSPSTPAAGVWGAIRQRWAAMGWEKSALGYPVTDETPTPDGRGRFNHFQHGSVYWSPATGAHDVQGAIRARWASLGWETGRLGYPVSDQYVVAGGSRSDFQGGSITWNASTGATTVTYTR